MKICFLNETKSLLFFSFHKLITLFHFSLEEKSEHIFEKTRVSCYQTLRGKQKYQITNVGVEKIKLSRLLVQRIHEFNIGTQGVQELFFCE